MMKNPLSIPLAIVGTLVAMTAVFRYEEISLFFSTQGKQVSIGDFDAAPVKDAPPSTLDAALHWLSVEASTPHPQDGGEVFLSLTPADRGEAPTIWNVTRKLAVTVDHPPPVDWNPRGVRRIVALGRFHGGLAPAQVEYEEEDPLERKSGKTESGPVPSLKKTPGQRPRMLRWGYVDPSGKWAIPPRFLDACPFVGEVAVVSIAKLAFRLLDRQGKESLPWGDADNRYVPNGPGIRDIKLDRLGRWTRIDHTGRWVDLADGGGTPIWLSDGKQTIAVPGVEGRPSADGELWLVRTEDGQRLWKPGAGFVQLPGGWIPSQPLSADRVLVLSRTSDSQALVSLDGRLIADGLGIVRPLSTNRFISCETGYSTALFDAADFGRNVGPGLPGHRCGIVDGDGKWWVKPVHQIIDVQGDHDVLLQSGGVACLVDLRQPAAPVCEAATAAQMPLPLLDLDGERIPRLYTFAETGRPPAGNHRFVAAHPYIGELAHATDPHKLSGLIDRSGAWVTPRPDGDLLTEAHLRAVLAQPSYRYRSVVGTGLQLENGQWAIPPVFDTVSLYPGGSVRACMHGNVHECRHLDQSGNVLPPTDEPTINSAKKEVKKVPFGDMAAKAPKPQDDNPASGEPVAVALNGRWGYQDADGKWVIQPRFDAAEDFRGGRAQAAVMRSVEGDVEANSDRSSGEPRESGGSGRNEALHWGQIDRSGNWVANPTDLEAPEDSAEPEDEPPAGPTPAADGWYKGVRVLQADLPPLPESLKRRWQVTQVRRMPAAKIHSIRGERPGAASEADARIAIVDDAGRYLIPKRSWWRTLTSFASGR